MDIAFLWRTNKAFDPDRWDETPFGGAEISSLNLAKQLCSKNTVTIYCGTLRNQNVKHGKGIIYFRTYEEVGKHDHQYFINVRLDPVISKRYPSMTKRPEKVIVWSGDAFDQPNNSLLHDPLMRDSFDAFVCKSEWQRRTLSNEFYYSDLPDKLHVIYNGVNLSYYKNYKDNKDEFIHASVIFRGAEKLTYLWPRIRAEIGNHITLRIFTKLSLYTGDPRSDARYLGLYDHLRSLDGVTMMEPVTQRELASYLCASGIMLYPNTFMESSCGVALESMAAGTPVVTTNMAGLAETVNMLQGGILIDRGNNYDQNFIRRTCELWQDDQKRQNMAASSRQLAKDHSWTLVAKHWQGFLKSL